MISVSKPEEDSLRVKIVLLVCDYLQQITFLGMAIAIVINQMCGFRCSDRKNNAIAPFKSIDYRFERQVKINHRGDSSSIGGNRK
jgi:hypothetical protein